VPIAVTKFATFPNNGRRARPAILANPRGVVELQSLMALRKSLPAMTHPGVRFLVVVPWHCKFCVLGELHYAVLDEGHLFQVRLFHIADCVASDELDGTSNLQPCHGARSLFDEIIFWLPNFGPLELA
jgi:hypothetical protein